MLVFLNEIAEFLEIPNISSISGSDSLEANGFDSLAMINVIAFLSNEHNIEIDPDELTDLYTIEDLDNFLKNKII